jgi:energy-coupling factor transporter ATP-binding protein EcfA2
LKSNYAIKGWLKKGETSVLFGPSNVGKSALVGMLACALVKGRPLFGARVCYSGVVHIAAESPSSVLERSAAYPFREDDAPYLVRESAVNLSDHGAVAQLETELQEIAARARIALGLVVFDTLARSIGIADENSASDMTRIADAAQKLARKLNTHVMLVHHTGKEAERGSRGSSALKSAVDTELSLARQKDGTIVLRQEKQRTMRVETPGAFRTEAVELGRDEDGDPVTTVRAVEVAPSSEDVATAPHDRSRERRAAVLTALGLLRARGARGDDTVSAKTLVDALPGELFEGLKPESRVKAVRRILAELERSRA